MIPLRSPVVYPESSTDYRFIVQFGINIIGLSFSDTIVNQYTQTVNNERLVCILLLYTVWYIKCLIIRSWKILKPLMCNCVNTDDYAKSLAKITIGQLLFYKCPKSKTFQAELCSYL